VAAASALRLAFYRPGRAATRISCPLLVVVYDDDHSVLTGPPTKVAKRAPRGEVMRLAGDHYAAFEDARDATLDAEIAFLRRHAVGVGEPAPPIESHPRALA
jgi:pimeloyl-ACP methyl ester carboxylesterase